MFLGPSFPKTSRFWLLKFLVLYGGPVKLAQLSSRRAPKQNVGRLADWWLDLSNVVPGETLPVLVDAITALRSPFTIETFILVAGCPDIHI